MNTHYLATQYPALVILAPLFLAFFVTLFGWTGRRAGYLIALVAMGLSLAASVGLLYEVATKGPVLYKLGGWAPPVGISYYVDGLNAVVLTVIAACALVTLVSTQAAVNRHYAGKTFAFYTLYLLSVTGHLGMVITGDAFNLYVLLEIAALTGYALLGMAGGRAALSTFNYLMVGTIGASFYLLGVGYLYIQTGSLNMLDLTPILAQLGPTPVVLTALGLILAGVFVKMALFPLHAWLPNAYTDAASPASALIAPMTTKVMVYVMLRMMLTVFTPDLTFANELFADALVWLGTAAIFAGALMALAARNLKRMLTYILLAEVGYMVGGAWLGNANGLTGAMLHIANDAVMTLAVFLVVACLGFRLKSLDFEDLRGAFDKMPLTMGALTVAAAAMIGVPPTCGFFSKWYLILGGLEAGHMQYVAALVFSSLINAVLFFRIFEIAYFPAPGPSAHGAHGNGHGAGHGTGHGTDHGTGHGADHGHGHAPAIPMDEAPGPMVAGLLVTAAALIGMGLASGEIVAVLTTVLPAGF